MKIHVRNNVTNANPAADNRQVRAIRRKSLGQGSACNGALYIRGPEQDYDSWNLLG